MAKFRLMVGTKGAPAPQPHRRTLRRWRKAAATEVAQPALESANAQVSAALAAAQRVRDAALAHYAALAGGAAGAPDQVRQQASGATDAAQDVLGKVSAEAVRRSAIVAQNLAKLGSDAGPVIASLAGQSRDYALQRGAEARDRLAPQVQAIQQSAAKQKEELAPVLEEWAEQARERLADLSVQARQEIVPALTDFVDQTRGRVGQLGEQAREQLVPAAAGMAAQARDRAVQMGSQTRDTAAALQETAGGVLPAVSGAAGETATAVGDALDATGKAIRSTVSGLIWLTVLSGIAIFLYAPKDEERAKLLAEAQGWLSYITDIVMELRGGD